MARKRKKINKVMLMGIRFELNSERLREQGQRSTLTVHACGEESKIRFTLKMNG
jgi:hypothetical protein